MSDPIKGNQQATRVSSQPGAPHWVTPAHGLRGPGQGYDFHDNVSLQSADELGAYESGHAIDMYGEVTFEKPRVDVAHGGLYDLNILRRYGSQGTYSFWITVDTDFSRGLVGDINSGVEHGFHVCLIDLDLGTQSKPGELMQDPMNPNRYMITFHEGEVKKTIRAICAYRTAVRWYRPVILQKPYTYWVNERFHAYAGDDEDELMKTQEPWKSNPDQLVGCEGSTNAVKFTYKLQNIELVDKASFLDEKSNAYEYRPEVNQHWTWYQLKSLPVPHYFIDPTVLGSPSVPDKERWVDRYSFYSHEGIEYTIGTTRECVAITRVYVHSQGGISAGRTGSPVLDQLPCCRDRTGKCESDSKGSYFSRDDIWEGGIGVEPPRTPGYRGINIHRVGLKDVWSDQFDFKYSPTDEYHSDYESRRLEVWNASSFDLWNRTYSTEWKNYGAGQVYLLGSKPDYIDLGQNVISLSFNWVGTDRNTLPDQYTKRSIDEDFALNGTLSGFAKAFDRFPYKLYESWVAQTGDHYGWAPFDNYNGRASTSGINYPHGENTIVNQLVSWYRSDKQPVTSWAFHQNLKMDFPGRGEDGMSNTLYDVSSLVHEPESYTKNRDLLGYYMCCIDHVNKKIRLNLSKVNEQDPVKIGRHAQHTVSIDKSTPYNIQQHSLYDTNVNPNFAMRPVKLPVAYQSWDDTPLAPSLTEQLFSRLGSNKFSPVLFLSLSGGANEGGSRPGNDIPTPQPRSTPVLRRSLERVTDTVDLSGYKSWIVAYSNVGGDHAQLVLAPQFQSTSNTVYGTLTAPGPGGTISTIASGDKLDDFSWVYDGPVRTDWMQTNVVNLSASETIYVKYTVNCDTLNPAGYNVFHQYQFDRGVLYGGQVNFRTTFEIGVS